MAIGDYPNGLPVGANSKRLPPWLNQLRGQFRPVQPPAPQNLFDPAMWYEDSRKNMAEWMRQQSKAQGVGRANNEHAPLSNLEQRLKYPERYAPGAGTEYYQGLPEAMGGHPPDIIPPASYGNGAAAGVMPIQNNPVGPMQALPSGGPAPLALNPGPEVWAQGGIPGQTPNFIAQGSVPGQPIPMGPGAAPSSVAASGFGDYDLIPSGADEFADWPPELRAKMAERLGQTTGRTAPSAPSAPRGPVPAAMDQYAGGWTPGPGQTPAAMDKYAAGWQTPNGKTPSIMDAYGGGYTPNASGVPGAMDAYGATIPSAMDANRGPLTNPTGIPSAMAEAQGVAAPGSPTPSPGRTLFGDPNAPRPQPTSPRYSAPRGPLTEGTFVGGPDGISPVQPTRFVDPNAPIGRTPILGGDAGLGQHGPNSSSFYGATDTGAVHGPNGQFFSPTDTGMQFGPQQARWYDGMQRGWGTIRGGKPIGSSWLPENLTRTNPTGKIGTMRRIGEGVLPMIGYQAAGNFVGSHADPNKTIGPVNKGTLDSAIAAGTIGSFGGVPGALAGGVAGGIADPAINIAGGELENESNEWVKTGKEALRAAGGLSGMIMNAGDWLNLGDKGSDANRGQGNGGGVGGLAGGITGQSGSAEAATNEPTPQNMMDRVFDTAKTPQDIRSDLQSFYDLMIANGEDPAEASALVRQTAVEDAQSRQAEARSASQVLAQQAQARKYMQPYADSLRNQGLAEQQLLQQLMPTLPAAYQGYGQYAANSAVTRANSLADSYMMQANMAPGQYQQQQAYAQQQAINNQFQQRLQAQGITEAVDMYNAGGGASGVLSGPGGGL